MTMLTRQEVEDLLGDEPLHAGSGWRRGSVIAG